MESICIVNLRLHTIYLLCEDRLPYFLGTFPLIGISSLFSYLYRLHSCAVLTILALSLFSILWLWQVEVVLVAAADTSSIVSLSVYCSNGIKPAYISTSACSVPTSVGVSLLGDSSGVSCLFLLPISISFSISWAVTKESKLTVWTILALPSSPHTFYLDNRIWWYILIPTGLSWFLWCFSSYCYSFEGPDINASHLQHPTTKSNWPQM